MAPLLIQVTGASEQNGKCKILSLKGGGIHGAWEAGVLKALTEAMPRNEIDYDHVAGVSIGAINASIFSTFPRGSERQASAMISSLYEDYTSEDLFSFYSPLIFAPFQHNSIADFQPCFEVLKKLLGDRPFERKLSLMTCDLNKA